MQKNNKCTHDAIQTRLFEFNLGVTKKSHKTLHKVLFIRLMISEI